MSQNLKNSYEGYTRINQPLNIDCKNGNLEELTQYLEKNVAGFHSDNFKMELLNNFVDGKDCYEILYCMQINGFHTPYVVMVFVEDNNISD